MKILNIVVLLLMLNVLAHSTEPSVYDGNAGVVYYNYDETCWDQVFEEVHPWYIAEYNQMLLEGTLDGTETEVYNYYSPNDTKKFVENLKGGILHNSLKADFEVLLLTGADPYLIEKTEFVYKNIKLLTANNVIANARDMTAIIAILRCLSKAEQE